MVSVNALNGLLSFLHTVGSWIDMVISACQRPKRASFISTKFVDSYVTKLAISCQRPKRASFISTNNEIRLCF